MESSAGTALIQPITLAWLPPTNHAYLRDAYRCLQMSHRDLWKPNCGGSGRLVVGRYKDVYISQPREKGQAIQHLPPSDKSQDRRRANRVTFPEFGPYDRRTLVTSACGSPQTPDENNVTERTSNEEKLNRSPHLISF